MIFHDVLQNSEQWEMLRTGRVTGSNFHSFMALDGDPVEQWIKKNIGSEDHILKSFIASNSGKKLGALQAKSINFLIDKLDVMPCNHTVTDFYQGIQGKVKELINPQPEFGLMAKKYALKIALEIINGRRAEYGFSNAHMERGHELEPIARQLYEQETFSIVSNGGYFDCGDYGDSPDGLVGDYGVIEIKCVIPETHYENMMRGAADPSYHWQRVAHLYCTGRQWVDQISYCSEFPEEKRLIINRVTRSELLEDIESVNARIPLFLALVRETIKNIGVEPILLSRNELDGVTI